MISTFITGWQLGEVVSGSDPYLTSGYTYVSGTPLGTSWWKSKLDTFLYSLLKIRYICSHKTGFLAFTCVQDWRFHTWSVAHFPHAIHTRFKAYLYSLSLRTARYLKRNISKCCMLEGQKYEIFQQYVYILPRVDVFYWWLKKTILENRNIVVPT